MISKFLASRFSGYLFIVAAAALLGAVFYIYREGKKSCASASNSAVIEEIKKDEKSKTEIRRLDDDALVKRYCRWVYDVPYDQCISTYSYVDKIEAN